MKDAYKVRIIEENLRQMEKDEYYLVRLKGDSGNAINLDEGALKELIKYYSERG